MLYCRNHNCARKDTCARYQRAKEINFQNNEGLWYVNETGASYGYKNKNDRDICAPGECQLYV